MSKPESRQENDKIDFSIDIQKADRMGALIVSLPKWIAWATIAWQIRLSIEALVGKYAFPSLLTRFWRQASAWEVACWGAGMLGLVFGVYSRRLLKRQITQDWSRIESMEKRLETLTAGTDVPGSADDRSQT
jgi:hypothetical protein